MSKPSNYDVHVFQTREGRWKARCTASGFTAFTKAFVEPWEAGLSAIPTWREQYHLKFLDHPSVPVVSLVR